MTTLQKREEAIKEGRKLHNGRLHGLCCSPEIIIHEINPLNPELNSICYLLALLGAHHFLHVGRIRVKSLTLRRLMSYIWSTHS